jgi:predicted metalloprotease with PDZ domain
VDATVNYYHSENSFPQYWINRLIHYTIFPKHPAAHLFEVTVTVRDPEPSGQKFMLPTWIPGSYMIREFARNIGRVTAQADGKPISCEKIDKCTWQCAATKGALTITYEVYAWDLSVRAAHLDETHGFFNGTSVFMLAEGFRDASCTLEIIRPVGTQYDKWQVASALLSKNGSIGTSCKDFGFYTADNYDELIDHPVELGTFTHATFTACGVTHHIALTGKHRADVSRLASDFQKFCEAQIRLFEPETATPPMHEYWFLIMVVGDGFGGLEHRASTALLVSRDDLPNANNEQITAGYRKLLSLASHEYFHTWNVKRILPAAFTPYPFTHEAYTKQLWFFEGITDYYDDLMLTRAGLVTPIEYLENEAENIGRVLAQSGRLKQSVAESSFDAWTKYYRQDENAVNSIVSYYQKGAMVGLALDLLIRDKTDNAKSLDDVMRALWNRYGKKNIGVPEGEIEKITCEIAQHDLTDFFANAVYGTADIDLVSAFTTVAIALTWRPIGAPVAAAKKAARAIPSIGVKISSDSNGDAKCAQVFDGGAAMAAGLSAGDIIIAFDGLRVNAANIERRIKTYDVGTVVNVVAFRRDEIMTRQLTLQVETKMTSVLTLNDQPKEAKLRRDSWLGVR